MRRSILSEGTRISAVITIPSVLLLFLCLHCAKAPDEAHPYLVLYAFDAEGELLAEKMAVDTTEKVLGRAVHSGELSGKDIVLAESGVGMTNAAIRLRVRNNMIKKISTNAAIATISRSDAAYCLMSLLVEPEPPI